MTFVLGGSICWNSQEFQATSKRILFWEHLHQNNSRGSRKQLISRSAMDMQLIAGSAADIQILKLNKESKHVDQNWGV